LNKITENHLAMRGVK